MKKTDLDFKDTHDENGIPICCMTCEYWSFSGGRSCDVKIDAFYRVCPNWKISKYYEKSKEVNNESILSKADGESQAR